MVTPPVSSSKFHMVIRELGAVKTKGGFAALNSGLLFLAFVFSLFLLTEHDRLIVSLSVLGCWVGSSLYFFINLKQGDDDNERRNSNNRSR